MHARGATRSLALSAIAALTVSALSIASPATAAPAPAGDTLPAGSSITVDALGAGKPGEALSSRLTITAPDDTIDTDPLTPGVQGDADSARDPLANQTYTLSVDHGFFTSGGEKLPIIVGAPAGNLVDLGATLTGVTDTNGQASFKLAIGRDQDFDDDGLVTATVTAGAGEVTGSQAASWDSAKPFNGGQLLVELTPQSEQPGPVQPAMAGDLTYFDVFTLDQYGNRVAEEPVDLAFSDLSGDYDYSDDFVDSNLDALGDFWMVSFRPATMKVTATWNAPTRLFTDTAGTTGVGTAVLSASNKASFYQPVFAAMGLSMESSVSDTTPVGSPVTHTVTLIDQRGNPAAGYTVQFFRDGPEGSSSEPRVTRTTNARGQASYTFVGTRTGRARITAEVSDGTDSRVVSRVVAFGQPVSARLKGRSNGARRDQVTLQVKPVAPGATITLFRLENGQRRAVAQRTLDKKGRAVFKVRDLNRKRPTTYVAAVASTSVTLIGGSNSVTVR